MHISLKVFPAQKKVDSNNVFRTHESLIIYAWFIKQKWNLLYDVGMQNVFGSQGDC
jgi:hypothetical protein